MEIANQGVVREMLTKPRILGQRAFLLSSTVSTPWPTSSVCLSSHKISIYSLFTVDLRHMTSAGHLSSQRSPHRASQLIRLGSRSPNSIPSSPTSVYVLYLFILSF